MSQNQITTYLYGIETSRNTIRNKLVELGIAQSADKLDVLASVIEDLANNGAVSVQIKEGDTYTIPAGYHNGNGTVSAVGGGGNYSLQAKTVTPTKKQQSVAPDSGYYGLSGVTVGAIPENYQDVSSVTAGADDVLTGKVIVTAYGVTTPGNMVNNGAVDVTIDCTTVTYTIPKGYHNGEGMVKLVVEKKTATPTKSTQKITPSSGKVLSEVTINPIPDKYQDVSEVTAVETSVLEGEVYVDSTGTVQHGSMPNKGAVSATIDGMTTTSYTIPAGYHNGSGVVSLTDDIEKALASI